MANKVVYTSDMHGNEAQYKTFVNYVLQTKPSIVIIGGELPPKRNIPGVDYSRMQRDFLANRLPALLKPIKNQLPHTQVYLLPGNDDCIINDDTLEANPNIFTNIDGKRLALPGGLEIAGYSVVPITPFKLKDREKWDLKVVPDSLHSEYHEREKGYLLSGNRTIRKNNQFSWKKFSFSNPNVDGTIEEDLQKELYTGNPKKTVYVFHTPPSNTNFDIVYDGIHVGSFALRQFIRAYQPLLTLHGHIHETVDMSGKYKEQLGESWMMSAGNHNEDSRLAVLVFDLDNLQEARRIKLPCTLLGKLVDKILRR